MFEAFLKLLLSEKSRVTIQLGILIAVILAASYAGYYARDFKYSQEKSLEQQEKISKSVQELVERSKSVWTYQMQREYDNSLTINPDGTIGRANILEIREKFSNQ
jgi:hypothetical protein